MTDALVRSTALPESSLAQLADVVLPPPVPWTPQTLGWQVVGVLLLLLALVLAWRAVRRYWRNRYRREALAELKRLEVQLDSTGETQVRAAVLAALAALIKRCALAAWPREQVAGLSGARWADFVLAHAGHARHAAQALAPLLREMQYHDERSLGRIALPEAQAMLTAAGQWIEGHGPA